MSDNSNEKKDEKKEPEKPVEENDGKSYEYELIGVTVHTGTADGGHYYAFIRDRYGIIFLFFNNLFLYLAIDTVFHPPGIIQNGMEISSKFHV